MTNDATVEALAQLFAKHPAWQQASRSIDPVSTSSVYFGHLPGQAWHLVRRDRGSELVVGKAEDPDFVFRFTEDAVARLNAVGGGIGAFASELFSLIDAENPKSRIDLRVVAEFSRLRKRGYLRLLLAVSPMVASYGVRRGVFGLRSLARFVRDARRQNPYDWEL